MKPIVRRVVCLAVLISPLALGSGCVVSDNPLSDPEKATPDEELFGVWKNADDKGIGYSAVGRVDQRKSRGIPEGMMKFTNCRIDRKTSVVTGGTGLVFPTVIGKSSYLNCVILNPSAAEKLQADKWTWDKKDIRQYWIVKYQIEKDRLMLYGRDNEAIDEAIRAGKIKGEGTGAGSRLTDTTDNLFRFFTLEGNSIYESTVKTTYTKVD